VIPRRHRHANLSALEISIARLIKRYTNALFTLHFIAAYKASIFVLSILLWSPCVADADIIFLPCGFYLSSSFFFSRLISAVAHWMSIILRYMVWP